MEEREGEEGRGEREVGYGWGMVSEGLGKGECEGGTKRVSVNT